MTDLPKLPEPTAPEPARCPHPTDDTTCGQPLTFTATVRELHRVLAWDGYELFVDGQASTQEGTTLSCTAGHEWAVPSVVYE